jgi:hypothetical protein
LVFVVGRRVGLPRLVVSCLFCYTKPSDRVIGEGVGGSWYM